MVVADDETETSGSSAGGREQQFEVEMILSKKYVRKCAENGFKYCKYYLVKWKGYTLKESTWEPWYNLENAPGCVAEFESRKDPELFPQTRECKEFQSPDCQRKKSNNTRTRGSTTRKKSNNTRTRGSTTVGSAVETRCITDRFN